MTETADRPPQTDPDTTAVVIDGREIRVAKGTLIIRAAEQAGIEIPRFCDHPLLAPAGACRQCLVSVEGQRKLVTSCTMPVADDMVVATQFSSAEVDEAQRGIMEFLLINHPLDCPVCDKGGECPLQNQAMSAGRSESRFVDLKRTFAKPVPLSTAILLDRERCILCARCTRFSDEIAGDPLIDLSERGALQQVTAYQDEPFDSYFSGNTVQICPVGALTGTSYRFRARPFDLVSTPSVCEHCSAGCAQRTDHRRGKVMRRLAGNDPAVNEEWNCDKGRWAFRYARTGRIKTPMIRGADGQLRETSWGEALTAAADGLRGVPTAVLPGGRLTVEDAYAYSRFARTVLGTNDIDFRARAGSREEADFLAAAVAGMGTEVIYDDLPAAPAVLLAGLEPEEECPMIFLRLRRAVRTRRQQVTTIAAFASPGTVKIGARLSQTPPGGEAAALREADDLVAAAGSIVLVGERLASVPGALSEALALAARTGARLAWVPRRAGERGALEVGALPDLLPGGAPVTDPAARQRFAELWDCDPLPADPGRDTPAMLAALADGTLAGALIGGVELDDLPDPALARAALTGDDGTKPFLVSLELRHSEITALADVVLPVAADAERAGTYVTWEGRPRPFGTALADAGTMPDARVLTALAARLDVRLDCADEAAVARQLAAITAWTGPRPAPTGIAAPVGSAGPGQAVLATWRMLLDGGALQDGDPELAGLAAAPRVLLSATTAADIGVTAGQPVAVSTEAGTITLPAVFADLPYRTVWLPMGSPGSAVHATLAARYGDVVTIKAGEQS